MKIIVTTIIVITIFSVIIDIEARRRRPNIFIVNDLPKNHNAFTIPGFGIFVTKAQAANIELLKHENLHWQQYQRIGLLPFIFDYFLNHLVSGYDENKYELEARANENEYCQENYTECVRNCHANTVCNINFRK